MSTKENHTPKYRESSFNCSHCDVYAEQIWMTPIGGYTASGTYNLFPLDFSATSCSHCKKVLIWFKDTIVYPKVMQVELPNSDLSASIQKDYKEAVAICNDSPRSAFALLCLILKKICQQLGESGENLKVDIQSLVNKGLDVKLQQSLEALQVFENSNLDTTIDKINVVKLFTLINLIANQMITNPKAVNSFVEDLSKASINIVNNVS